MDAAFQTLALKIGIELPERFSALITMAQADREILRSAYDLFWLDAEEAEREIDEWLHPDEQQGRTFLPFATNGSGEPHCLVRLENGATGIAQALHYGQTTRLAHSDISSWVASHYVRLAADVSRLTFPEIGAALLHEVQWLHSALLPADRALLADLFSRPCVSMTFKEGPDSSSKTVSAFISQAEEKSLLKNLQPPDPIEFAVLRDWMR